VSSLIQVTQLPVSYKAFVELFRNLQWVTGRSDWLMILIFINSLYTVFTLSGEFRGF